MSVECLKTRGQIVEIGKKDQLENNDLQLRPFLNNVSFHAVHIDRLMGKRPQIIASLLSRMGTLVEELKIQPKIDSIHQIEDIQNAFQRIKLGQHIENSSFTDAKVETIKTIFGGNSLIAGGTGALGVALSNWLVEYQQAKSVF